MKNKRGSHIGIIISFSIFIFFLVFFYMTIYPVMEMNQRGRTILDYIKIEFEDRTSSELTIISLKINGEVDSDCIILDGFFDVFGGDNSVYMVSKNALNDEIYETRKFEGNLIISDASESEDVSDFIKIFNSSMFEPTPTEDITPCVPYPLGENEGDYFIGQISKEFFIFEEKIKQIFQDYKEDYEFLKSNMRIPDSEDFMIEFRYQNGTSIKSYDYDSIPSSINVYSEENQILYLDEELNKKAGYLRVTVW